MKKPVIKLSTPTKTIQVAEDLITQNDNIIELSRHKEGSFTHIEVEVKNRQTLQSIVIDNKPISNPIQGRYY